MPPAAERQATVALTGTPQEVREQLRKSDAERVLAFPLGHMDEAAFESLAENFSALMSHYTAVLRKRQERERLDVLVDTLVPSQPVPPRLLKESMMLVEARRAVLESGDWLSAADVARLAGLSANNPSAQPNKWKRNGAIFAIHHNGVDYFPGYGLDADAGFRPFKPLAEIIQVFTGHKDAWGMAYWFLSPNGLLGGKRPQDVLGSQPARVIEAARDEIQAIAHG